MAGMFYNTIFNQDISTWNTANVTDMSNMFGYASAFNQDIGGWHTGKVTNMRAMFGYACAFNQNIGGWNVGALTDATNMFSGVALSSIHYDALLQGWDEQALQSTVTFSGGNSQYCAGKSAREPGLSIRMGHHRRRVQLPAGKRLRHHRQDR